MNRKTLAAALSVLGAGLGAAGLILILLSVLADRNTLVWGMLCVALGTLCSIILMQRNRKTREQ